MKIEKDDFYKDIKYLANVIKKKKKKRGDLHGRDINPHGRS